MLLPNCSVVASLFKLRSAILVLFFYSLFSCIKPPKETIRIAAAASVQFALQALIEDFEATDSVKVDAVISSSGKLTAQIMQGAPFDLFLSADTSYPAFVHRNNKSLHPPFVYGQGQLVLWASDNKTQGLNLDLLTHPSIRKIGLADPNTAPFGQLSVRCLKQHHLYQKLLPKLVFGQSVAQVSQYVMTGAVDMGLSSLSIVLSKEAAHHGIYLPINDFKIPQSMVLLSSNRPPKKAALRFYRYMQSRAARRILQTYGL